VINATALNVRTELAITQQITAISENISTPRPATAYQPAPATAVTSPASPVAAAVNSSEVSPSGTPVGPAAQAAQRAGGAKRAVSPVEA
jgi:hypothetical protein